MLSTVERRRLFEFFSGHSGAYLIVAGREVSGVEVQVHLPDRDPENVMKLLMEIVDDKSAADRLTAKLDLNASRPLESLAYRFDIVLRGRSQTLFENKLQGG